MSIEEEFMLRWGGPITPQEFFELHRVSDYFHGMPKTVDIEDLELRVAAINSGKPLEQDRRLWEEGFGLPFPEKEDW